MSMAAFSQVTGVAPAISMRPTSARERRCLLMPGSSGMIPPRYMICFNPAISAAAAMLKAALRSAAA